MGNRKRNRTKVRSNGNKKNRSTHQLTDGINKVPDGDTQSSDHMMYSGSDFKEEYDKYFEMSLESIIDKLDMKMIQSDTDIHKIREYIKNKTIRGASSSKSPDEQIYKLSHRLLDKYPKWMFVFIEKELMSFFKSIRSYLKSVTTRVSIIDSIKGICLMWKRFRDITVFIGKLFFHLQDKMRHIGYDKLSVNNLSNILFYEVVLLKTNFEDDIIKIINSKDMHPNLFIPKQVIEQLELMKCSIKEIKSEWRKWKIPIIKFHFNCERFSSYHTILNDCTCHHDYHSNTHKHSEEGKQISSSDDESLDEDEMYHIDEEKISSEELKRIYVDLHAKGSLKSFVDDKILNERIVWFHKNSLTEKFYPKSACQDCEHHKSITMGVNDLEHIDEDHSDFNECDEQEDFNSSDLESVETLEYRLRGNSDKNLQISFDDGKKILHYTSSDECSTYNEHDYTDSDDEYTDSDDDSDDDSDEDFQVEIGFKPGFRPNNRLFNLRNRILKSSRKKVQKTVVPYVEEKRSVDDLVKFIEGDKEDKQNTKSKKKKKKKKKKKNNTEENIIEGDTNPVCSEHLHPPPESQVIQKTEKLLKTTEKKKELTKEKVNKQETNNQQDFNETKLYPEFNDSVEDDKEIEMFSKKLETSRTISSTDTVEKKSNHHLEDLAKWAREVQKNKFKNLYPSDNVLNNGQQNEMKLK